MQALRKWILPLLVVALLIIWSTQRGRDLEPEPPKSRLEVETPEQMQRLDHPPTAPVGYRHANATLPSDLERMFSGTTALLAIPQQRLILWSRNDDELVPIASMTKMMTALVAHSVITEDAAMSLGTPVRVSAKAAGVGGSQVWLMANQPYIVEDLFRAMLIKSANDAAHALGEAAAPDNDIRKFVQLMNRRARRLGMVRSRFYNVHGLPGNTAEEDNVSTCREILALAEAVMANETIMSWLGTASATFEHPNRKVIDMLNHNRLLLSCPGVNGLKTGYIRRSGYCVTASCERGGRTVIAIVTGFPRRKERDRFVSNLLAWAFTYSLQGAAPSEAPAGEQADSDVRHQF